MALEDEETAELVFRFAAKKNAVTPAELQRALTMCLLPILRLLPATRRRAAVDAAFELAAQPATDAEQKLSGIGKGDFRTWLGRHAGAGD